MALQQLEVELFLRQDDSLSQGRKEVAASRIPVPIGTRQASPLLLFRRHHPLVGQISEGFFVFFSGQPPLLPWAELSCPEVLPEGGETEVLVQQQSAQVEEVHVGGLSRDIEGFSEGGAGVVRVGLSWVNSIKGGDDGSSLGP